MSNPTPVTVLLANRPRLFRELLHHALNTASEPFHVVEATDNSPSPTLLREADWVVVDEESASDAARLVNNHPRLGILVLEGRGSSARVLSPATDTHWHQLSDVPTLSKLFSLLSAKSSTATQEG